MPETPGEGLASIKNDGVKDSASITPEVLVRQESEDGPVDSPSHESSIVDPPSAVDEQPLPLNPEPNPDAKSSVESVDTLKPTKANCDHEAAKHPVHGLEPGSKDNGSDQIDRATVTSPSQGSTVAQQPSVIVSRPVTPTQEHVETQNPPQQESTSPFTSLGLLNNPGSPQASRPPTSDPATTRPVSVPGFSSSDTGVQQYLEQLTGHTFSKSGYGARPVHPPMLPPNSSQSPVRPHSAISGVLAGEEPRTVHSSAETPPPSQGLQSPLVRSPLSTRQSGAESSEGRPSSRVLQNPTDRKEPEETNKLNKRWDQATGRKHLNNYELFEPKLGSGQHGTVKRGRNIETGETVAVKIVRRFSKRVRLGKTGDPNDAIKKEVAILKKARHPHVVGLYEVIDDPEFDKVYLVLEFVERGEIVWRKPAEKSVAQFEMNRSLREVEARKMEADISPLLETQALDGFNLGADGRRIAREENAAALRQQAIEQLMTGNIQRPGSSLSQSLYGEGQADPIRKSRADQHEEDHPSEPPQSATPMSSMLSAQYAGNLLDSPSNSHPGTAPSSTFNSRHNSRRNSLALLEGTQYGPYVDAGADLEARIEKQVEELLVLQREKESWTAEEEYFRWVPCLTLPQACDAFRDTLLGIEYLHYQGIIHRDIKPANLLWTHNYRVKISDFGVSYLGKPMRGESEHEDFPADSKEAHDEILELAKTVGTPAFYAPELCDPDIFDPEKQSKRPAITGQIDIWALGVTLYCMVYGRLPFFDLNEFRMYEKIAREEVFIHKVRLQGVSHTDKTPSNNDKRLDEVLEYEEVDDTLQDLMRRLLVKDPTKRMTLAEVKHHPWVLSRVDNKEEWMAVTDPSRQSEGKKIEVSTQEVQEAVVGLNLLGRIVEGVQRFVRGSSQRKRNNSNPKPHERASSTVPHFNDARRGSLREDQQIVAALKHHKETSHKEPSEHPLSHSVAASPGASSGRDYFGLDDEEQRPHSAVDTLHGHRPSLTSSSMSTVDSMKTITGREPFRRQSVIDTKQSNSTEDLSSTTHSVEQGSSSSLGGMITGASRRIVNTFRGSRERGLNGNSPSESSRSSSIDRTSRNVSVEDYHAVPSLGYSSAIASGHVDSPAALREEGEQYSFPNESSAESLPQRHSSNVQQRRRQLEAARRGAHRRSISYASPTHIPPLEDDLPLTQPRPMSAAESSFAISSSSDQIVSGESHVHSRIPSTVSRASSVSAPIEDDAKRFIPQAWPKNLPSAPSGADLDKTISADPAIAKARAQQDEEAGYNGGAEEQDSDSEDEGLTIA